MAGLKLPNKASSSEVDSCKKAFEEGRTADSDAAHEKRSKRKKAELQRQHSRGTGNLVARKVVQSVTAVADELP